MTTIDREQLINSLVERTGMERAAVAQQLAKLESRIKKAKTAEVPFEIENFGTFTTVENQLEFIPDDVLETEINNRYAGMKPIELIEAFKSPEGEPVPVADSPIGQSDVKQYDEKPSGQPEDDEEKEEPPKEQSEKPKEESVPVAEQSQTSKKEEELEQSEKEDTVAPSAAAIKTKEQREEETAEKNGKGSTKDPIGQTVLVIAIILCLAIAGWMAYDFGLFGSEGTNNGTPDDNNQQPPVEQSQESEIGLESSTVQAEGDGENGVEEEQIPVEEKSEVGNESGSSTVETDEPYGLYGNIQEDAGNYYTIVVHSMQTIPQAEEKQQEVLEQGSFRTEIKEANVNGSTYYRIGIGQFETIDAAQQAAEELPEPYRSNNFISRF